MLYEFLAGRPPYEGDNNLAIMNQHVTMSPPLLHYFRNDVPPALEEAIMKAIRRDPDRRWQSTQEFEHALLQPDSVDVAALRAEREHKEANPALSAVDARLESQLGLPLWQVALIITAVLVALAALGVHVQKRNVVAHKAPFPLANRNVQLFLAYSILWEAFNHIYTAASYTHFALHGAEYDELEEERAKIERVLRPPILTDADLATIKVLKNGETVNSAINRMINRSSRELKELYGVAYDQTLTDMNAFLQGVVEVEETRSPEGTWLPQSQAQSWVVKALDSSGRPIDPESDWSAEKYRSVIKWHCYQIRNNLNFVGKTEGSIDDAILIIRAFCLVEPVVALLLQESRRALIFAL